MVSDIFPLNYGTLYHIYNRGNNGENIFPQERNYAYFLELWQKHIGSVAETWAYCCLRNHFHAVVYIRNKEDLTGIKPPSKYFSNFFNAYARGLNISIQRTGALFERPFKRIPIDSTSYLIRVIVYIHQNAQRHHFVTDFRNWNYSSYHVLTSAVDTWLSRDRVIELFGSREDFVRIHQEVQPLEGFDDEE